MPAFMARLFRPLTSVTTNVSGATNGAAGINRALPEGAELATIAAGCFWGVEHIYRKHFKDAKNGGGLYDARVGYTGGTTSNPTYRDVCSGTTGHAEALQITFDPTKISYRELIEFLYKTHDPTTANRQGNDRGTQYRSAIFFHSPQQEAIAREVTEQVQAAQWFGSSPITTEIKPATQWYDAEDGHQLYLERNPHGYQCENHFLRKFAPLPASSL
ncbi:peptide methionine sulfoxide reductase MsrA [Microdochium trichocladiopsis]|uniref:peptide-methionine (S)-S-oxide reductase n=1 Tax=Microdochium trichocladiopsis TaxID=1682393 RepID=A0A9P9BSG3_9PEZI|nr:peptide methionine sulfoxide reductase MsrA [Microdochium trichocladiopsis]KAH7034544.1 peptide methionine sulfoxide reductase MsrA [Microdochium trichocladiopsis]